MADLLEQVAAVAAEAGRLGTRRAAEGFRSWEKTPGSPVCEVDLEIDALIKARLSAIDPTAGWLSEETADDPVRLAQSRLWVVDPIDGTRDYVRGRAGWAVSIALVEHGQPIIGVLDAPVRREVWLAEAGRGATRNGEPIHASRRETFPGSRVPTDSLPKVDRDLVAVEKPNSIALRIAMVAANRADLLATLRWGYEWDVAAAVLIAREAGAAVTDALGGELAFNTPKAQAFGVLVSAPAIHAAAVERLAERARAALRT
ncbi:3'(2'),5'-bisphosphate nucleotidase CysQ [Sphingomonas gilva]|uniref:3'(2'),5'-bisphosphate nucleotidase CysQ n=1 Tax=Sphingomonas gilva TaxID=2305907 RepID=A0A396RWR2_9SPHN|nr:3'(2'),5'-bisphosphate nucleotidase CysQ [Sphingomonas gilva]RHW18151.1 3'(2'),5'-bisphosphate nucleotidase CysQ [Sphingomonas gilva]